MPRDLFLEAAAQKYGVDPQLAYSVAQAESTGNPRTRDSSKGAMGQMQLMPGTARDMGVDPRDPLQNVEGGVKYLKMLMDRYQDPVKAVAAYNAGMRNVDKYGGVPPFPETQAYVDKVNPQATPEPKREPVDLFAKHGIDPKATPTPAPVAQQVAQEEPFDVNNWLGKFEQAGPEADKKLGKISKGFIETAIGTVAPVAKAGSMLARAGRNIATGAAVGAQHGETLEEKLKGGVLGAASAGAVEAAVPLGIIGRRTVSKTYGAANELDKQLRGKFKPSDLEKPLEAPAPWSYTSMPEVKQTAGMLSTDPRILKLEQGARVRNTDGQFTLRDLQNTKAVYDSLERKAMPHEEFADKVDALGRKTEPMRRDAFDAARLSQGLYQTPLMREVERLETMPGIRGTRGAEVIASKARKMLSQKNIQPEDLYALRKELDDALNAKGINLDEATNAIKGARREAMAVKKAIDESLEGYSGGLWTDYLDTYAQGMRPLKEGKAFQNIIDSTQNNYRLPLEGSEARNITRAGLRRAAAKNTYERMGKGGMKDILSESSRNDLNDAIGVLEKTEKVRTGAIAINGSRTSSDVANLGQQGLKYLVGGKTGAAIDWITSLGASRGLRELDDALLNPDNGKLQTLLDIYQKSKRPGMVSQGLRRGTRAATAGYGTWDK